MGEYTKAVGRTLSSGKNVSYWEAGVKRPVGRLVGKVFGSRKATAEALGVSERTVRRWEQGTQTPSKRNREKITTNIRESFVDPAQDRKFSTASLPGGDTSIRITGWFQVSKSLRYRSINFPPSGFANTARNAYLNGDDEGVEQAIESLVRETIPYPGADASVSEPVIEFH